MHFFLSYMSEKLHISHISSFRSLNYLYVSCETLRCLISQIIWTEMPFELEKESNY